MILFPNASVYKGSMNEPHKQPFLGFEKVLYACLEDFEQLKSVSIPEILHVFLPRRNNTSRKKKVRKIKNIFVNLHCIGHAKAARMPAISLFLKRNRLSAFQSLRVVSLTLKLHKLIRLRHAIVRQ